MNAEIETIAGRITAAIDELVQIARPLDAQCLNRAPDGVGGANSAFVIVTHVLGNVRAWVIGIVCEEPIGRDRASEFRSHGSAEELRAASLTLVDDYLHALRKLDGSRLDDVILPRQELFGEGETRQMSRREALLHPLEHANIHLGQLQLTVSLVS